MADPGFPRGGALTLRGAPTYYLANFSQKLHENEDILGQKGGRGPSCPPLDQPLVTDEDYLWSLGYLGNSTPDQLLNTMVFCVGKGFALWASKEHRALRAIPFNSQLAFHRDDDNEIYLQYTEDIGLKTNKGGLKHKKVEPKTVVMYASDRPDCCPLCIILKYMALLPKTRTCQAFYLQPRETFFGRSWYLNRPAGVNKLRDIIGCMCRDAGLPGHYTNHSLRSLAATKMYQMDLDKQLIMEVTGHRSTAVRSYKRTSQKQRKVASKCIFLDWTLSGIIMAFILYRAIRHVTRYVYCDFLFIVANVPLFIVQYTCWTLVYSLWCAISWK